MNKKGFTLVELLIVIAILAILSVAVVLVLNPAELIRQSRDSTRISDMAALNSAISLYLTDVATPYLGGPSTTCVAGASASKCNTATTTAPFSGGAATCTAVATTTPDGTGWVTVNFNAISAGSPLSRLPVDPTNSASYTYAYTCSGLSYKLGAVLESNKYGNATTGYMRNAYDGGTAAGWYEVGNNMSL